jgi:hypothetical protein
MAQFALELPQDLIAQFNKLNDNTDKVLGDMTQAGAKAVMDKIKTKCPDVLKNKIKISVTYKTPSDGGINTKVYFSGYIPFSDPNRNYFSSVVKGHRYDNSKGVPASFLAILYEYGRSNAPFPKHPSLRSAFGNKSAIEQAMMEAQEKGWEILGINASMR